METSNPLLSKKGIAIYFILSCLLAFGVGGVARYFLLCDFLYDAHTILTEDGFNTEPACYGHSVSEGGGHKGNSNTVIFPELKNSPHAVGEILLIDINEVIGNVPKNKYELLQAMKEIVLQTKLTLVTHQEYELHDCERANMNSDRNSTCNAGCVGILLEGQIHLHALPGSGVIFISLFSHNNSGPTLSNLVSIITPMFGKPSTTWASKSRGFSNDRKRNYENQIAWDLREDILGNLRFDIKDEVSSNETPSGRIDIYDIIDPRTSNNLESSSSDRQVFLDGKLRSSTRGDEAFFESIVHPAMFTHSNPKRIAIVGGGVETISGATIREVLKHKTVEKVTLVGGDETLMKIAREHLAPWNSCVNIEGSTPSCFDDPRVEIFHESQFSWFVDCYCNQTGFVEVDFSDPSWNWDCLPTIDVNADRYDVIILGLLDPKNDMDVGHNIYNNDYLATVLSYALDKGGVLSLPLGKSPNFRSTPEQFSHIANYNTIFEYWIEYDLDVESYHVYEESHSQLGAPWAVVVACKDVKCRLNWFKNSAELDVDIYHRIVPPAAGSSSPVLKYFDSATMLSYQMPPKIFETLYCRKKPTPILCKSYRGIPSDLINAHAKNFVAKQSTIGEGAGRGLFPLVDIPKGHAIALDQSVDPIYFSANMLDLIDHWKRVKNRKFHAAPVAGYFFFYGYETDIKGVPEWHVESGILMMANHGCNGTQNVGPLSLSALELLSESTADIEKLKMAVSAPNEGFEYDPVIDRHLVQYTSGNDFALRDLKAGEEIFTNYLPYTLSKTEWLFEVNELRKVCGMPKL